jgi:hypothetical protein
MQPITMRSFAQKVLLTLPQGEQILYAESSLSMFDTEGGLQVCTGNNKGQYFVYKNNKKLGPFSDLQKVASLIEYPDSYAYDENTGMPVNEAYNDNIVSYDENGSSFIAFGNKKYGPFSQVKDLYLTKQNSKFWAVVALPQTDYLKPPQFQLIGSLAPATDIKGDPYDLKVNNDLSMALVASRVENQGEIDMDAMNKYSQELEKLMAEMGDELDMDKLAEMSKKMEKLTTQNQMQNAQFHICTSESKHFGPFCSMYPGEKNPAFCASEGSNWYFVADGFLYKNGTKTTSLPDSDINQIWWSANAQSFAYSTYEKLIFSSGEQFPFPLEMKTVTENGKTTLKWLALEDGQKLVLYNKTL